MSLFSEIQMTMLPKKTSINSEITHILPKRLNQKFTVKRYMF